MTQDTELAELIDRMAEAAPAYIRGDIRRYFELIPHTDDYTLMAPSGGEPRRDFDRSDESLDATARYFQGGEATLEVVDSGMSGDLAFLVAIERQHGKVGDMPEQDWSLRITLVYRRVGTQWRLAHRHADPLVHPVTMEQVAALARGDAPA